MTLTILPKKKYYREYLAQWGWGVMIKYDTVIVTSKSKAKKEPCWSKYGHHDEFECIIKVKKTHLNMTDEELSKIYGYQEGAKGA